MSTDTMFWLLVLFIIAFSDNGGDMLFRIAILLVVYSIYSTPIPTAP